MDAQNGETLVIMPSLLCNIRCAFCFQDRFDHEVHLTPEVLYEKLRHIYPRVRRFTLLGGEPTAIPNLDEYVFWLLETYPEIELQVVTNGVRLTSKWRDILSRPNVIATISLNASRPDIYAATQNIGQAEKLWSNAFNNVVDLAERRRGKGGNMTLSMVATSAIMGDVLHFIALAYALGIDAKVLVDCRGFERQDADGIFAAYPLLRCLTGMRFGGTNVRVINLLDDSLVPRSEDEGNLDAKLAACLLDIQERLSLGHNMPPPMGSRSNEPADRPFGADNGEIGGAAVCLAPWRGLVVGHSGSVYCCSRMTTRPLGNINEQPLDALLSGPVIREIREHMVEGRFTFCDPDCAANLNKPSGIRFADRIFRSGDYAKALPLYRELTSAVLDASATYAYAYCEHVAGDPAAACVLYDLALERGFDPYWVYAHRALVKGVLGDADGAKKDEALAEKAQLQSART